MTDSCSAVMCRDFMRGHALMAALHMVVCKSDCDQHLFALQAGVAHSVQHGHIAGLGAA